MLRETTFLVGRALTSLLGVLLAVGLLWAGAGVWFFEAYLGAGIAVGLGLFFCWVGWAEGAARRRELAALEPSGDGPG